MSQYTADDLAEAASPAEPAPLRLDRTDGGFRVDRGGGVTAFWPDIEEPPPYTLEFAVLLALVAVALATSAIAGRWLGPAGSWLRPWGPWLILSAVVVTAWELLTAKYGLLPRPSSRAAVVAGGLRRRLAAPWPSVLPFAACCWRAAIAIGAVLGFVAGVAIGWSRAVGYWVHPVLRFVGPLPATAWLPLAFFVFPSSWSASVFLIALATGFPVDGADLVRRRGRQRRLLRRRANAGRQRPAS